MIPSFDHWIDIPGWLTAKTDEERQKIVEETDTGGAQEFRKAHPEYFPSDFNLSIVSARLQGLPLTFWNLEIAYADLRGAGLLEIPPPPAAPEVDTSRGITQELAGISEYVPSDAERTALAKLQDNSALNDSQRKARLKKLALLSNKQRREMSKLPGSPSRAYPSGSDPKISI